jgi:hypothetical protein
MQKRWPGLTKPAMERRPTDCSIFRKTTVCGLSVIAVCTHVELVEPSRRRDRSCCVARGGTTSYVAEPRWQVETLAFGGTGEAALGPLPTAVYELHRSSGRS